MITFIKHNSKLLLFIFLLLFCIYSTILVVINTVGDIADRHLVILAGEFLKSNTAIPPHGLPNGDIVNFHSTFYLYFGPFSSILLMPFVLILGYTTPQLIVGILSLIVSFFAVYAIAKSFKFATLDALFLALFFVFSTVLFGVSVFNISAYQVQALGTALMLLSLWAYFTKKPAFLIGLFLALAILTRFPLGIAVIFFIIEFLSRRISVKQIAIICLAVFLAGLILGLYNYKRFHSFTETGYRFNVTLQSYPMSSNLQAGFLSVEHIPANLYSFLLMPPEPVLKPGGGFILQFPYIQANPWGMAIWFTSPLFFLMLSKFKKNKYSLSLLISTLFLAVPAFLYFGIGFVQFGYRYALDFLPFLFLLLIPYLSHPLSKKELTLIIIGVIFNCIFATSLWDIYPHFGILK